MVAHQLRDGEHAEVFVYSWGGAVTPRACAMLERDFFSLFPFSPFFPFSLFGFPFNRHIRATAAVFGVILYSREWLTHTSRLPPIDCNGFEQRYLLLVRPCIRVHWLPSKLLGARGTGGPGGGGGDDGNIEV